MISGLPPGRGELTFSRDRTTETDIAPVPPEDDRIPILYLAPWVDIGGSDTSTIDWFRTLDRTRFRASLITTQPSPNRRLAEIAPYAEELWELPQLLAGKEFPRFILSFVHTRGIRVLHIMNSHLGFELLPEVAGLPDPPRVVVQFHGEEPGRSGYVRYVATRYEKLVDAFSLTSAEVGPHLEEYGVPAAKRRIIHIGVDADHEFSPDRVPPIDGLAPDTFHVLFPARLTAQKDPLLMVEVAAHLRASGLAFQIHVVGDGDLDDSVAQAVRDRDLGREVILHGATDRVAPWYRACRAMLLTSAYETSYPRAVYEAMAMGTPAVVPKLATLEGLAEPGTAVLVDPPDQAAAYAEALRGLAEDPALARAIGNAGRDRARSRFTLTRMAAEHAALYEQLLARSARSMRPPPSLPVSGAPGAAGTIAFRDRHPGARPLVSVIVTCYERARYLADCLGSITAQSYKPIEILLVDDHSTDPETRQALDDIERRGLATVMRLPANRGPAAARNAGLELARGRYILPLDDDDLLPEDAITEMVEQLASAGERTGFVYPSLQFFGSRTDFLQMPSYNLRTLMDSNQCPVSCLFDRQVFDHGLRYDEEIRLGHEDWDFVLTLAEHGIRGEAARTKTLLCRKHGFNRSDLVEAQMRFGDVIAARHPRLFAQREAIKARWSPALTVIALDPVPSAERLADAAATQTCSDFELIVRSPNEPGATGMAERLRRIPSALAGSRAEALADAVRVSRGQFVLATYGSTLELLADRTLVEKLLRILVGQPEVSAIGLYDAAAELPAWRLLDSESVAGATLGALAWRSAESAVAIESFPLQGQQPLDELARWISIHGVTQWRNLPALRDQHGDTRPPAAAIALGRQQLRRAADAGSANVRPALPESPSAHPPGPANPPVWKPPQSRLLCRYRDPRSGRYLFSTSPPSPAGFELDRALGYLRESSLVGTVALAVTDDPAGFVLDPEDPVTRDAVLGFLEHQPLAMRVQVLMGRDPATDQTVLAAGEQDPLAATMHARTAIGYLEAYPIGPPPPQAARPGLGLTGLVRTADQRLRRHRYGAGHVPEGLAAGELGALFTAPTGACDPLWIDPSGRVLTPGPGMPRPSLRAAVRWAGDPLTWAEGPFGMIPRLRATVRRGLDVAGMLTAPGNDLESPEQPAGYLLRSATPQTVPLHLAVHPVTGDQLLTTEPSEAEKLGYGPVISLGHVVAQAPVTGRLGPLRPAAPWTAQFGRVELEHD